MNSPKRITLHFTGAVSLAIMALSKEEREQFLAEPHVAALSVSAGDKRGPLTVPIWYQYSPGGEPWVHTGAGSRKHRLIETQGEFTLMVDRVEPTVRYVTVDGPVSRIEPATDEQLVEMVKRYLPPEAVDGYLEFARREHGEGVVIYMKPANWLSERVHAPAVVLPFSVGGSPGAKDLFGLFDDTLNKLLAAN